MPAACESSPETVEPAQSKRNVPSNNEAIAEQTESGATMTNAGLGVIVYNDKTRAECKRRAQPGSRIHRRNCDADDPLDATGADLTETLVRAPINQRRVAK